MNLWPKEYNERIKVLNKIYGNKYLGKEVYQILDKEVYQTILKKPDTVYVLTI